MLSNIVVRERQTIATNSNFAIQRKKEVLIDLEEDLFA